MLAEDRLGMELHALQRQRPVAHPHHSAVVAARADDQGVGHVQRRQRVVAHRLEVLRHPGEHTAPVVRHQRQVAVSGGDAVDHAAVRRDQALHAQAHPQHRDRPVQQHLSPDREVALVGGRPRAGREDDVREAEQVRRRRVVVLHHRRQHAGHRGDEVHEVPGVGVVVVDDDDVRPGHRLNLSVSLGSVPRTRASPGRSPGGDGRRRTPAAWPSSWRPPTHRHRR